METMQNLQGTVQSRVSEPEEEGLISPSASEEASSGKINGSIASRHVAPPELETVAEAIYETRRRMHEDRAPFRELYPSASRPYLEEAAAAIRALSRTDELRPSEKDPALGYRVLIFDLRKTTPSRMTQERAAQAIETLCARLKLVTLERDALRAAQHSDRVKDDNTTFPRNEVTEGTSNPPSPQAPSKGEVEIRDVLEDIRNTCGRNPLMVGFVHSEPTRKELQERLDSIKAIVEAALSAPPTGETVRVPREPTDEMVTAFMREFEKWTPLLRYKEAEKWHVNDVVGVRHGLRAALSPSPTREG
jgi:hypothetical protein